MKINTKFFGTINIDKKNIINFPYGLPGFEDLKKFIVLDIEDHDIFKCLQSIEQKEIAFFIINPWDFFSDYNIEIPEIELKEINIKEKEEIALFNMVTIPDDYKKMTANLLAPLVINTKNKVGKQIVLQDHAYQTKHFLFKKEVAENACAK